MNARANLTSSASAVPNADTDRSHVLRIAQAVKQSEGFEPTSPRRPALASAKPRRTLESFLSPELELSVETPTTTSPAPSDPSLPLELELSFSAPLDHTKSIELAEDGANAPVQPSRRQTPQRHAKRIFAPWAIGGVAIICLVMGGWMTRDEARTSQAPGLAAGVLLSEVPSHSLRQAPAITTSEVSPIGHRDFAPQGKIQRTAKGKDRGKKSPMLSCPAGMVNIELGGCIDEAEFPGRGSMPRVGVTLRQAQLLCERRGAHLCSVDEWQSACSGKSRYCQLDEVRSAAPDVRASGMQARCKANNGALDLLGNVGEWVNVAPGVGAIMGGDVGSLRSDVSCATRRDPASETSDARVGFRCCNQPFGGR